MKVAIKNLKALCDKILTRVEENGYGEIDIDIDYYWMVDYDINKMEPEQAVGSFIDDWESLLKVINNENPVSIVDFDRLAYVVKMLGETLQNTDFI